MSSPRGVGRGLNVKNVKIYGKGNRGGAGDARSGAGRVGARRSGGEVGALRRAGSTGKEK